MALASLALVASAGCSDEKDPTVLPTLTATPTPSAGPVEVPAAARAATPQGAAAFVRFYFAELDRAYQRGSSFPLAQLSHPSCKSCSNFAGIAQDLMKDGRRFAGPTFTNIQAEAAPVERSRSTVLFASDLPAREELDRTGEIVERHAAEKRLVMNIVVEHRAHGWQVLTMVNQ